MVCGYVLQKNELFRVPPLYFVFVFMFLFIAV
jgi:hypothetical protein